MGEGRLCWVWTSRRPAGHVPVGRQRQLQQLRRGVLACFRHVLGVFRVRAAGTSERRVQAVERMGRAPECSGTRVSLPATSSPRLCLLPSEESPSVRAAAVAPRGSVATRASWVLAVGTELRVGGGRPLVTRVSPPGTREALAGGVSTSACREGPGCLHPRDCVSRGHGRRMRRRALSPAVHSRRPL